ncbi:taste receptor type 2 member 10-like [Discoglossus pictus]
MTNYEVAAFGIILLETVVGSLVNGFMAMVNLLDLLAQGRLNSIDSILTCLGISRFCFQWLVLAMYTLSLLYSGLATSDGVMMKFMYSWLFVNNTCLWFATWLCTFYCFHIVNSQHRLFAYLKSHFDSWVPALLVVAVAMSVLCTAPFAQNNSIFGDWDFSNGENKNKSEPFHLTGASLATYSSLCIVGSTPPFIIFCATAWMVVNSLMQHTIRMKAQVRTGFREPSMKAHYGAVKSMFYFFLFYLLYMVALNLRMSGTTQDDSQLGCFCAAMIGAYPSMHSVLLMFGNGKLRQTIDKVLQKGKCWNLQTSLAETMSEQTAKTEPC